MNFSRFTFSTHDRSAATERAETFLSQNVSNPAMLHFCKRIRMLALLGVSIAPCLKSFAQAPVYAMYPQTQGKVEPLKLESLPSWMSLDGQVRLRTEDFESDFRHFAGRCIQPQQIAISILFTNRYRRV